MHGTVAGLHRSAENTFSKGSVDEVALVAGIGVDGDAHAGPTVMHRSRRKRDPSQPNLRQVHLIAGEVHDGLRADGFDVPLGAFGENITTRGIALGDLPVGTTLRLGDDAIIALTGFRDPCAQIDDLHEGLRAAVAFKPSTGPALFRNGVMAVVVRGGIVRVGDPIGMALPPEPHQPMEKI
jgi:MOSC domain-containing protein YiiM